MLLHNKQFKTLKLQKNNNKFNFSIVLTLLFTLIHVSNVSFLNSQTLYFYNVDKTKYPLFQANYIYLDNSFNNQNVNSPQDFKIFDNDLSLEPIANINGGQLEFEQNQVVIAYDLSIDTTKQINLNEIQSKWDLAQKLLINIINNDNLGKTKFTLLPFDYKNYPLVVNSDDKSTLLNSLTNLVHYRYSSIDTLFNSIPFSLSNIFDLEKFNSVAFSNNVKKTVFLITDKNLITDQSKLDLYKSILAKNNLNLVLCLINEKVSNDFVDIINHSNNAKAGYYVDNIKTDFSDNLLQFNAKVLNGFINGAKGNELIWLGKYNCENEHNVKTIIDNSEFSFHYSIVDSLKPRFKIDKPFINFSSIYPRTSVEEEIIFTADNTDIAISKFEIERDYDSVFTIIEGQITSSNPIVVRKGESHKIKIKYLPIDSTIVFVKLIARSTACNGQEVLITGGFPNTPPKRKNVEILTPQCEDVLFTGDIHTVKWAGVLPKDVIQLEYSLDNGRTWDTLGTNLTDLEHNWKVPNFESDKCLVRIIQLWPNNIGRTINLGHGDILFSARFNTIGDKTVTACKNGDVIIWNSNTGKIIRKLEGHKREVYHAEFSYNERYVISASEDSTSKVWSVDDGKLIYDFKHGSRVTYATFGRNNNLIATSTTEGFVRIFDMKDGKLIKIFRPDSINSANNNRINNVAFTKDGKSLITGGINGFVKFWDLANVRNQNNLTLIKTYDVRNESKKGIILNFSLSPNEDRISVVDLLNSRCTTWDLLTDKLLYEVRHHTSPIINSSSFYYNSKDSFLITSSVDNRSVVWHARTGDSIKVFWEHNKSVQTTFFNFDGSRVLTSSWDSTAKIWMLDQKDLQMDTSDCVFKIVKPKVKTNNVNISNTIVGEYSDFWVNNVIENISQFGFSIRNIDIIGDNKSDFEILEVAKLNKNTNTYFVIENKNNFTIDSNEIIAIKFRFKPKLIGNKNAKLQITIPGQIIEVNLSGNAINQDLVTSILSYDLGELEIGNFIDTQLENYITNTSNKIILINNIQVTKPNPESFKVLDKKSNFSISQNSSSNNTIRFIPLSDEQVFSILEVNHNGINSPNKILLFAKGSKPVVDSVIIGLTPIQGKISDVVNLDITLKKLSEKPLKNTLTGIKTRIKFNATILKPIDNFTVDYIHNNERFIELEIPFDYSKFANKLDLNEDVVIYTIPFKIALGNDTITKIEVLNSLPLGQGNIALFESNTEFNILDYCSDGGVRLIDAIGNLELKQNYPNPANETTTIEFSILEEGNHSLYLQDLNGIVVLDVFEDYLRPGSYINTINTKQLSSGLYNLVLKTPTQTKNILIHISN